MMGVKPKDVMKKYVEMGADVVGANCGSTLDNMELVVKEYAATVPNFPLWVKPNAGVPHMSEPFEHIAHLIPNRVADPLAKNFMSK